jgi:hypothetical protein
MKSVTLLKHTLDVNRHIRVQLQGNGKFATALQYLVGLNLNSNNNNDEVHGDGLSTVCS